MRNRYAIRDLNNRLDATTDAQQITRNLSVYEYPWLLRHALEFALFRTYAVPTISALLDRSGQFNGSGQKRYDDTSLIIAEIVENGYDSDRGRTAIRRMNQLHRRFTISNDDYLYVLSTFTFEPHRWVERFGWRPFTENEQAAGFVFWSEVGRRMNTKDIPPTVEAFEAFNIAYEREHFHYTPSNERVGAATVEVFASWYPVFTRPMVRESIYALLDDPLREAFGFPKPSSAVIALAERGLKLRGQMIRRFFPPRKSPFLLTEAPNRTYPQGYALTKLGPDDAPPMEQEQSA